MKLSARLRELSAAQEPCEPFTRDYGRKMAFEGAAELAELYEAEHEKRIMELEAQLAWTPLGDAPPSDVFLVRSGQKRPVLVYQSTHGKTKLVEDGMYRSWSYIQKHYTHYRRIELPEAT